MLLKKNQIKNNIIKSNPNLSLDFLDAHFSRLDNRYFQCFTEPEIINHLNSLSILKDDQPIVILARKISLQNHNQIKKQKIECTFITYDAPGLFSAITGLLSGMSFEIISGDIFTYKKIEEKKTIPSYKRKCLNSFNYIELNTRNNHEEYNKRFIIDKFIGVIDESINFEYWQKKINDLAKDIFLLIHEQKETKAKQMINNLVSKRLATLAVNIAPVLYPVQIKTKILPNYTSLKIYAQDTPAFLYSLGYALSYNKIMIEHVSIKTINNEIKDELDIIDENNLPITDEKKLEQIKLAIMLTKQFTYFIHYAPDPFSALQRFESLIQEISNSNQPKEWFGILSNAQKIHDLAKILGTSDYLWEDFIRLQYENLIPILKPFIKNNANENLEIIKKYKNSLKKAISFSEQKQIINEFKDQMLFRIDLKNIILSENFRSLSHDLTRLAETMLKDSLKIIYEKLILIHGKPKTTFGFSAEYALLGLGKMGGSALGYASDIELLFIYSDSGFTEKSKISNEEFFEQLVKELNNFLNTKRDGIFKLDFRLRPYGEDGTLATSLNTFCKYYALDGDAYFFEKLALTRLRFIAGAKIFGNKIENLRDQLIYNLQKINPNDLWELRKKQFEEKIIDGKANAKFSPGGLVDIEYAVQLLQIIYGKDYPNLRTPSIHQALDELKYIEILDQETAENLKKAYDFFRILINGLRLLRGNAKDLFLPDINSLEFNHLARRMGYTKKVELDPAKKLHLEYETQSAIVRNFIEHYFTRDALANPNAGTIADIIISDKLPENLRMDILKELGFQDQQKAYKNFKKLTKSKKNKSIFARIAIITSTIFPNLPDPDSALNNWERFVSKLNRPITHYKLLLEQPKRVEILLTLFSLSPYLSNILINNPIYFNWVSNPKVLLKPINKSKLEQELNRFTKKYPEEEKWLDVLRRIKNRETLRIAIKDLCLNFTFREIITDISDLADFLIEVSFKKTYQKIFNNDDYLISIFALGKLGAKELNYSSDIDLIAIIKKECTEKEKEKINLVLKNFIKNLSIHTQEGFVYRVDFRLRPFGSGGELAINLQYLKKYYEKSADLWEIQALIKLRYIVGNLKISQDFKKLAFEIIKNNCEEKRIKESIIKMRQKAVQELAIPNTINIKNDKGGIRDIEFLAQGLELINLSKFKKKTIPDTLSTLSTLNYLSIISDNNLHELIQAYQYLRKIENFLQVYEDQQIYGLNENNSEIDLLIKQITFILKKPFSLDDLKNKMKKIHEIYLKGFAF